MSELKLLKCLSEIQNVCIGELAMGYKLDVQSIGQAIYEATGMTEPLLRAHIKELEQGVNK